MCTYNKTSLEGSEVRVGKGRGRIRVRSGSRAETCNVSFAYVPGMQLLLLPYTEYLVPGRPYLGACIVRGMVGRTTAATTAVPDQTAAPINSLFSSIIHAMSRKSRRSLSRTAVLLCKLPGVQSTRLYYAARAGAPSLSPSRRIITGMTCRGTFVVPKQ